MRTVHVFTEMRFARLASGRIATDGPMHYEFWRRYHSAFERVVVVARVGDTQDVPDAMEDVEGQGVEVAALPDKVGLRGQVSILPLLGRIVLQAQDSVVLARVPSVHGAVAVLATRLMGGIAACEVVGDPNDAFAPGVTPHPLRPVVRLGLTSIQRLACSLSSGVSYVTSSHLQRRYPANHTAIQGSYSSVSLSDADFTSSDKDFTEVNHFEVVACGYMDQPYKRFDQLIEVVAQLHEAGRDVRLTLVGDGRLKPDLEALAQSLDISEHVHFAGFISDRELYRELLSSCHLFVHPSATEGLPRVVIEAMARSMPVIATSAGGTAELLDRRALVTPDAPEELFDALAAAFDNPELLAAWADQNRESASRFSAEAVGAARAAFLCELAAAGK